jgi:co-chaperonin GroES (HSP10)
MTPLHDRVLVQRDEERPGGLIVVRNDEAAVDGVGGDYRHRFLTGKVVAAGPKCDPDIHPGVRLIFSNWDDADGVFVDGMQMIRQKDIAGILND